MSSRLRGKIAIVFGAGSVGPGWGNGKATATLFAREGAHVVCVDFNPDASGDLFFNGVDGKLNRSVMSNGLQFDSSYEINDSHTLRRLPRAG